MVKFIGYNDDCKALHRDSCAYKVSRHKTMISQLYKLDSKCGDWYEDPLTIRLKVIAKNHPFFYFLSGTESRFFNWKDDYFSTFCPENDNDSKSPKFVWKIATAVIWS